MIPMIITRRRLIYSATFCIFLAGIATFAQQAQYAASLLSGLVWRDVGPMRGGRSYGVAGHADQPDTFYFGSVGGGVWKTENSGRTWVPISDEGIPIGSIGAIAVAPSNPNIIYVGTGEPDIRAQHSYGIGYPKFQRRGKLGRILASKRRGRSGAWSWIRRIRIACTLRRWAMCMPRIRSAGSIARSTVAQRGRKSCSRQR